MHGNLKTALIGSVLALGLIGTASAQTSIHQQEARVVGPMTPWASSGEQPPVFEGRAVYNSGNAAFNRNHFGDGHMGYYTDIPENPRLGE